MSIESRVPSNHLVLSHLLLLLPSIFLSIRVFSNESALSIRWPKYWSFSFSINPFSDYSGLISFKIDWFDLLVVQKTLQSFLQHHSSKASILPCSAFFMVHLSHPCMTTGKTIVLTRWVFVGEIISLLFNMLSRLVIAFLLRNKCLLIYRLGLLWCWMVGPGNKLRSFCYFDIVPKYCISDSSADYEGYFISSKGFLSTVVDIMAFWIKFPPFTSIWVHWFLRY